MNKKSIGKSGKTFVPIFKEYGYSKIAYECDLIQDLYKQLTFLNYNYDCLQSSYNNYILTEFKNLSKKVKESIVNWFNIKFNNGIKSFISLDQNINKYADIDFSIFRRFLCFIAKFVKSKIEKMIFDSEKHFDNGFKETFKFKITYDDYIKLVKISEQQKKFENDIRKISLLKDVKYSFFNYKEENNPYEFKNCVFDEVESIKMFSEYLESYKVKFVYLNYAYQFLFDEDEREFIQPEINRIKNILELENTNDVDVSVKHIVGINSEEKNLTKTIKKFQWNDTEESILRILDLLFNSDFITLNSYKNRSATLRDTFLNKEGKPFNNKQLNKVSSSLNINKKIKKTDFEYTRFDKLRSLLNKLIED